MAAQYTSTEYEYEYGDRLVRVLVGYSYEYGLYGHSVSTSTVRPSYGPFRYVSELLNVTTVEQGMARILSIVRCRLKDEGGGTFGSSNPPPT